MRWRADWLRDQFHGFVRAVLPNACVACERLVEAGEPDTLVCGLCRSRMQTVATGCARCGQPEPLIGGCRFCADWPRVLTSARSAVWLTGEARAVVHHLKYEDYPSLAGVMAQIMRRRITRPENGVLVPVPLTSRKQRLRGYNQAEKLAAALGAEWHLPVGAETMRRVQDSGTQTALTPEARLANVAAAFAATRPGRDRHAILVDDVFTTGATLRSAASALGQAGWEEVSAVTFARALPYEIRALVDRSTTT